MITLTYILHLGAAHWPVSPALAYGALTEMAIECTMLWSIVLIGLWREL